MSGTARTARGAGIRRTIILTGASSGLGAVAAERLAADGADVAVVGRDPERTRAVADRVGGTAFLADFDHLDDVRALASALLARYERIDVLANNAGGIMARHAFTLDGNERIFQANHLAPFLLTNLLTPRLVASAAHAEVRVLSTSSRAHRYGRLRLDDLAWTRRPWLNGWPAYGTAKLATILFIRELAERMTGTGVRAYSFHPGLVVTGFGRELPLLRLANAVTGGRYGITAARGAVPLVHLAGAEDVGAPSGSYFDRLTANATTTAQANDAELGRRLWDTSAQLVGLEREG